MTFNNYDSFSSIDTTTYDWKCRVRAQTIWKGINNKTQQYWGINIIFLDDSNNRMHAFINTKNAEKLQEEITEGEIYTLSNFKVKHYLGDETFRAVRTDKHIYFTEHTNCTKNISDGLQIERYAFDLFALEEIEKSAQDNRYLVDVAGILQNLKPMVSTMKNNVETKRLMFEITDGSSTMNVTLFNQFGETHEAELEKVENDRVVVIISAAKINVYDGKINLTNYPATRLYINPDHYCVPYLKKSYEDRPMLNISSDEEEEIKKFFSISEIQSLGAEFIEKTVSTKVLLKRVDETATWYYARCPKCKIEVFRQAKRYTCSQCQRIIPHPDKRFRVFTLCADKTGCIGIVFPDYEVKRIVQKSVFDIHAEYSEEPAEEPFPAILKQLQHKDYTVTLVLTKDNIKNGSTVYEAVEVLNVVEGSANYSPGKQTSEKQADMSIVNETAITKETPETAKSTNMKLRVRKNPGTLPYDQNIGDTKNHKNIKTERI